METFTKGDIVLYHFPFTDLSRRKLRPCLVLSDVMGKDILLCQITSKRIKKDGYVVEIDKSETKEGSLMLDSYIRCNMIFTASTTQIQKKICKIPKKVYLEVVMKINKVIIF